MNPIEPEKAVLVCQNRGCNRAGAEQVFAAFQRQLPAGIRLVKTACLGHCGNGPTVLVLPEQVWYCQVQPEEVTAIVERHLIQGHPIEAMRCKKT
jgi:(2Fe-2S) ferredoxin